MGFAETGVRVFEELRRARAVGGESSFFRQTFRKDLHGTLITNLARIGLLTPRVRTNLERLRIRVPGDVVSATV